jgi:hypothetical protein
MYNCQIAGINLNIRWDNEKKKDKYYKYHDCTVLPRSLAAFSVDEIPDEPDMKIRVHKLDKFSDFENCKRIYNQAFCEKDDKLIITIYDPYAPANPGYSITSSRDYSQVEFTPYISEYEHYDLQWMMHPFECRVLYKGGIVLHGAAVEYGGKGFIFTGISGAGKSTQAHLWQKYRNAYIINGDCPLIRMTDGIPQVFGTPWFGTSGEFINRRAALSAVILVKRGEKNSIRELVGNSAFLAVLANVLHSNFDLNTIDLAISNLNSMMKHIHVFELTCTISEEAVQILEKEIM